MIGATICYLLAGIVLLLAAFPFEADDSPGRADLGSAGEPWRPLPAGVSSPFTRRAAVQPMTDAVVPLGWSG